MEKTNKVILKSLMLAVLAVGGLNMIDYIYAASSAHATTSTDCGNIDESSALCMSANLASSATVTISGLVDGKAEIEITPSSAGTMNYKDITVTSYTNSSTGYNLAVNIDNGETDKTSLVNTTDSTKTIPTLLASVAQADFSSSTNSTNRWGLAVDAGAYQPATASMSLKTTDAATGASGSATTVRLGAKADLESGFSGKYSTTLNFVVTANVAP